MSNFKNVLDSIYVEGSEIEFEEIEHRIKKLESRKDNKNFAKLRKEVISLLNRNISDDSFLLNLDTHRLIVFLGWCFEYRPCTLLSTMSRIKDLSLKISN